MRIFLIRHGETPWTRARRYQGRTDVPLNREGIQQAQSIARVLRPERPACLFTSTLQRAQATAEIVGRSLGLKPLVDARLNEIDFGKWEGAFFPELAKERGNEFRLWREGRLRKAPGGESLASLSRRIGQFLKDLLRRPSEETVAIISHGGPIKMFLFEVLKMPCSSIWSFRIDPGSISLVEGNRHLFQIVWTNRTDHLNSK